MKSRELADYFQCNYDTECVQSGAVYTQVFTTCTVGTQDKKGCSELYEVWIGGDMTDKKNLLLRAMAFNHDKIAIAVKKAVGVSIDWRAIPWDSLSNTYKEAIARLAKSAEDSAANFVIAFAGPIARMFGKVLDGKYGIRGAVMGIGLISGHPILKFTITDNRKNVRKLITKEILSAAGVKLNKNKLSSMIGAQLTLLGLDGVKMTGNRTATFLIILDRSMTGMPPGISVDEQYKWAVRKLLTAQNVEDLNIGRFRQVINTDVRFGAVAGILQLASLTKLIDDDAKALDDSKVDARRRLQTGIATLAITTGEVIGNAWKGALTLKYGAGHASIWATRLLNVTKILGVGAGLFVAWLEFKQSAEALEEKQVELGVLYIGAGIFGIGLTVSLAYPLILGAAAIPIIGVLFFIVICIGIMIEYMKDNPVQDWLERCPWGILPQQRYPNEAMEQSEFQLAIKG